MSCRSRAMRLRSSAMASRAISAWASASCLLRSTTLSMPPVATEASRMPSSSPIGIPRPRYSGSRLASIRQTTLIGPPSVATKSNSRRIRSSTSSIAAMISVEKSGTAISRAM